MSFKLVILTSLYKEYIDQYYLKYSFTKSSPNKEQYEHLLNDTSEPAASYTRMFNKMGINTTCIIENAKYLQKSWASENGIKTRNNKEVIYSQLKKIGPDVLWIENIEYTEKGWISYLRNSLPNIKLIIASHCAPYSSRIIDRFKGLDFVITCTPGIKNDFDKNGLSSYMVYHGFDPSVLVRLKNEKPFKNNDFVFSGSLLLGGGFHNERIQLLDEIFNEKIALKIYGNLERDYKIFAKQSAYVVINLLKNLKLDEYIHHIPVLNRHEEYGNTKISKYSKQLVRATELPVFGIDMFNLLQHAKITLNNHGKVAGDYAGNMRLFEATGVGSCLLTDNKKNMSDLFNFGDEVVVYDNVNDCVDKIKWLLDNENERKRIAESGQNRTLKTHNIEERCNTIVGIISRELKNR